MDTNDFQKLREKVGLSRQDFSEIFDISETNIIHAWEDGSVAIPKNIIQDLAMLDARVESAVISEIDTFTARAERDTILIRFLSENDFALYEPDLFEQFFRASVHGAYIARAKRAIERIGGEVTVAFMESTFYETWLGVNDFDDSRDLRISWARQQIRGLSK